MNGFSVDILNTFWISRLPGEGPLPPRLIGMTLITGLVDAFSYLVLGHVFVANAQLVPPDRPSPVNASKTEWTGRRYERDEPWAQST